METTSAKPGQTFVENWIVIHHYRILKYFYFNISYKGKIDSLNPPEYRLQKILKKTSGDKNFNRFCHRPDFTPDTL
jgi:hypothetical protein